MRDRRRLREVGSEPPFGDPGVTIRECRDPETEAAKLEGPRVAVIRSAREGRQLLERLGAESGSTSRLPRNRALERAEQARIAAETTEAQEQADDDAEIRDEPDLSDDNAPIPLRRDRSNPDLDAIEMRLRVAAAATSHWALRGAHAEEERLHGLALKLRRAVVVVGALLAVVGVALIAFHMPITIGLALVGIVVILLLVQRLHRAEAGADEAADAAVTIEIGLLADHGLPPSSRADLLPWSTMLARSGLAPTSPDLVDEAVEELRQRVVRPSRGVEATPPRRRSNAGATAEAAEPKAVSSPGPGERPSVDNPIDLVVVVDDGLYVGHRLALRDVSEKLATRVPLLVLATNERLWSATGRTR